MGGVLGHFRNTVLTKGAPHHAVRHTVEHAGGVGDRLAAAQLGSGLVDHQRIAAEFGHADGEAGAGAGARLVENHRDALWSGERLMVEAILMELDGEFKYLLLLLMVQIIVAQHVAQFGCCHGKAPFDKWLWPMSVVGQVGRNTGKDGHRLVNVLLSDDQRWCETQCVRRDGVDDETMLQSPVHGRV